MPFRRRRRSGARSVRNREWISARTSAGDDYQLPSPVSIGPNSFLPFWIVSPGDVTEFWDEPTVVRMVGHASILIDDIQAPFPAFNNTLNFGIIPWKSDAANSPNELIDVEDGGKDWLYWQNYHLWNTGPNTIGLPSAQDVLFDVKGMRKLPLGFGLAAALSTPSNNTHFLAFSSSVRILLLNN